MPEWQFECVTEDMTEEEVAKMKEDAETRKSEWMKKNKKKPKTEEEDAEDLEQLKTQISEKIKEKVVNEDTIIGDIESKIEMKNLSDLLHNHIVMNKDKWDELYRKKSILDVDCESKNVLLRLDLDVPISEYNPPVEEDKEEIKQMDTKRGAKMAATESQIGTSSRVGTVKSSVDQTSKHHLTINLYV
jgi:3-phosphoglycerate kinase